MGKNVVVFYHGHGVTWIGLFILKKIFALQFLEDLRQGLRQHLALGSDQVLL